MCYVFYVRGFYRKICILIMILNLCLLKIFRKRKRPVVKLTDEEIESRALLLKEWTRYKKQEYISNVNQIDRIMAAQRRALDMLYEESEELYNEAIMVNFNIYSVLK